MTSAGQAGAAVAVGLLLLIAGAATPAGTGEHRHPAPVVLAPGYGELEFIPPAAGTYALPPLGAAADGPVLDMTASARRLNDYMGDKLVVLSFIYTACSDVNGCPLATFVLKRLQQKILADAILKDRVRLISLSFDPDHDTPAVLRDYSRHFRAPGFDWEFLTCASEHALAPILDAYGQSVIRDVDPAGRPLGTMSHVLRVYLIDTGRQIRNIYTVSYLHADTVAADLRTLLAEQARG